MLLQLRLADRLGKTLAEIQGITAEELVLWMAYFRLEHSEAKKVKS